MTVSRTGYDTTDLTNKALLAAVVASIPAAMLLVIAQRYIAAGVTTGAVKD